MGGFGRTAPAVEAAHRARERGWCPGGTLFNWSTCCARSNSFRTGTDQTGNACIALAGREDTYLTA